MAQEYKIKSIKKGDQWSSTYGTFQSYALALDGIGEPVQLNKKVPVNKEPQEGDVLYGNLEEKTSKTGRQYYSFKSEQKPDYQSSNNKGYDSDGAKFGGALKIASDFYLMHPAGKEYVENAKDFITAVHSMASEIFKLEPVVTETNKDAELKSLEQSYTPDVVAPVPNGEINLDNIPF